jgi:hypothetical protein
MEVNTNQGFDFKGQNLWTEQSSLLKKEKKRNLLQFFKKKNKRKGRL